MSFPSLEEKSYLRVILDTLEDFDVIATWGTGAVIFPRRYSSAGTQMAENLHAALAATSLGLSSIDYVRKRYSSPVPERGPHPALAGYLRAYGEAKSYIGACARAMVPNDDVHLRFGTFAASIALERLPTSLTAAHLLYRLGLNYEGDTVSRQVLEQIAWAVAASDLDDENAVQRLRPAGAIRELKALVPYAGELYGRLSTTTHASLREHRQLVRLDGERASLLLAWQRLSWSAATLFQLADLWVVGYEWTQRDHMETFQALDRANGFVPRRPREFLKLAQDIVTEIQAAEEDADFTV